jgi:hypothetical protein
MISLDRIRELEPTLKDAPDEDVAIIREQLYALGQLAFDTWTVKNGSKIAVGLKELDESK